MRKLGFVGLLLGSVIWFAACGGSGNNNGGAVTFVTVSCSPMSIMSGQTSQCSATVQGTGNFSAAVTWSASTGTISSSGLFTAPGTDTTLEVTITATSNQTASVSGTTTVTVNPNNSTVTGVSVSCNPSTITPGQTSQCTATVTGTGSFSQAVNWSANNGGTINSSGLLSFNQSLTSPVQVTVTATSQQNQNVSGTFAVTVNPGTVANNVAPISVDDALNIGAVNIPYVTVTICAPGTNNCETIDHVQVDTGSEGMRLLSTASGGEFNPGAINLQPETISGNPVDECLVFADGYVWGPVYNATVTIAGESAGAASGVPIHVLIPANASPGVPSTCSSQNPQGGAGNEGGSVLAFGANGIIGVGPFQTDCGEYCVVDGQGCGSSNQPCVYYQCPSSGCTGTNVALTQQVPNPVTGFAADNNGVLIQLPTVPDGGSPNPTGSLIFGIGTQSNNSLSLAANVYPIPDQGNNAGDIITTYNGQTYPQSFLDSGSNGLFFLDSSTTGIPTCPSPNQFWYCPTNSPDSITVTNQGQNNNGPVGSPVQTMFMIENANNLFNTNNTAFSTLGGPNTGTFDFGLSFFFGKDVFTAIDQAPVPNGPTGPFFAY